MAAPAMQYNGHSSTDVALHEALQDAQSRLPPPPPNTIRTPTRPRRSLSDATPRPIQLEPSPRITEAPRPPIDDGDPNCTPTKSNKRPTTNTAGLTIHMPPADSFFTNFGSDRKSVRDETVEGKETQHGSPCSVLPRHSRGLDFARAATNLHHSTLADQPSPCSSPTITHRSIGGPSRRQSTHSMAIDSPRMPTGWSWGSLGDKNAFPRSVGSTNAMTSDASSSSSDDDEEMIQALPEPDETMIATPHAQKFENSVVTTPYGGPKGSTFGNPFAFNMFRNNPLNKNRNRKSSASVGGNHTMANAGMRNSGNLDGYFQMDEAAAASPTSRRESISLGTRGLHITSSNETSDENSKAPMTPGVVRRPVATRRSNLIPKTKTFARIRAALQEEHAPVETESKREAEVIRQVKVNDVGVKQAPNAQNPPSPDLQPTISQSTADSEVSDTSMANAYGKPATDSRRHSSQKDFWLSGFAAQTPPPPLFGRHRSSSGISEEMRVDSPSTTTTPPSSAISTTPTTMAQDGKADSDNTSQASAPFQPPNLPTAADISKRIGKRRRDDDFDPSSIKRRAVSPMSVQSSPILGQSPVSSSGGWWGQPKVQREGSSGMNNEERSTSNGSAGQTTPNLGPKRVGLQGMSDTNDGLKMMSIE